MPRSSSLRFQFILVIVLVFAFALGMAVFLSYFKYQKSLEGLVQSRIAVVGLDMQNSIENAIAVGLDLRELTTVQQLIERERASDPLVAQIHVIVADDGQVLYTTNPDRRAKPAPPGWLAAARKVGKNDQWRFDDPAGYTIVGVPLHNSFDLVVGWVALRYDHAYLARKVSAMGALLGRYAAVIFALFVIVTSALLSFVLGGFIRDLRATRPALERAARGEAVPPAPPDAGPLETQVAVFGATIAQASDALHRADVALGEARA